MPRFPLPPEAIPYLQSLRVAMSLYRSQRHAAQLEGAFAAAVALVGTVMEPRHAGRPDLEQMRELAAVLPEFGELVSAAAAEAERAVCTGTAGLWRTLGLRSAAPAWTPAEREAARMVFACACAPAQQNSPARLQGGLRALAAARFADQLSRELAESEDAWTRALGDRYESVRHRCARRTTWRSLGLSELVRTDEPSRRAVTQRLERWIAAGGLLPALASELEAALVHARTPARFA
ncbi:MAG: hypothetical protein WBQ18_06095 [Solirubrobacteraceae bacterium]